MTLKVCSANAILGSNLDYPLVPETEHVQARRHKSPSDTPCMYATLSAVHMAEPEAVARVLTDVIRVNPTDGDWLADLHGFDKAERIELCDALKSQGVALADRSKLRRLATSGRKSPDSTVVPQMTELTTRSMPRKLQEGSSGSMDSIALAVTALLGIVSYLVQAKLSRDAERSQKESDRTHADIARVEAKTENQLTRVQTQMERFVQPFSASISQTAQAILNTMGELGLQFQIEHWQLAWLKVSAAPHIEVQHIGNPAAYAASFKSPYFKLAPQDIAVLEGDPMVRQRYTELVAATWLPPLRDMVELFTTQVHSWARVRALLAILLGTHTIIMKVIITVRSKEVRPTRVLQTHLNDGIDLEQLEVLMPRSLGVTWAVALGSASTILSQTCTYVRQLESVVVRWQNGDYSMLQPVTANPFFVTIAIAASVKKEAGRKELELLGQSSAARNATGGTQTSKIFFQGANKQTT
jgi:hypothetical protein